MIIYKLFYFIFLVKISYIFLKNVTIYPNNLLNPSFSGLILGALHCIISSQYHTQNLSFFDKYTSFALSQ
jgi:hypothetical protein